MSINLFPANEITQSKQKSKHFMLCHIGNLNERMGDVKECHFINAHNKKLRRANFHSLLPESCLQNCNCGPKSHQLSVQLVSCISKTGHSQSRIPLENREMMSSITWPTTATASHLRDLDKDVHPLHWQPLQPAFLTESFLWGPLSKWPVIELYKTALILWAKMRLIFELRGLLLSTVHYKTNTKYFINRSPYSVLEKQCIFHAP